jgi:predicted permease
VAPLVSQAWRSWKSAKAVAVLVVVAFTVGIGSATAIYTVINSLLLKPVPYAHGERFVSLLGAHTDDPARMASLPLADVLEYQQRTRSFDVFGWIKPASYNLTAPGPPLFLNGVEVTPSLANSLGVNPRVGQWFRDGDTVPVAVISDALWLRLGADPGMVGKTITLGGRIYTVAAVMPPGFRLPYWAPYSDARIDFWLPLDPLGRGQKRDEGPYFCYARLRPGVTSVEAEAEVKRVAADIAKREPAARQLYTARVDDLRALATRDIKPVLLLLFAAAELLLLITCANVGGLLLARSVARARETAVRVALGARLRQLAFQYFFEGLFVSLAGAAGGLLFSVVLVRILVSFAGPAGPRTDEIAMDWKVLLFALATALLASLITSLVPLRQAARTQPNDVLSEGVRASAGARSRRLSESFVVAEIALAFVLLAGGAILISEFYHLIHVWPGFDPRHLLTFQITFAREEVPGKPSQVSYQARLIEALEAVPGVSGAGIVNQLPLDCCFSTAIYPEGALASPSRGETVSFLPVNPGYFRALGLTLRRGRFLDRRDDTVDKIAPVVINQASVARYWPNQDPIGAFGRFNRPDGDRFQVVGVVGDVKNNGLDSATVPEIYLSSAVAPPNPMRFVLRSPLPVGTLVPQVRRAIQSVNAGQPIHDVRTMEEIVRASVTLKRVASYVVTFFALAALLMAALGAYGVVSYSVRQRTVEIGIRMALGATSRDVLRLVVGAGLRMAAYGVAIGVVASMASAWLLVRQFGIQNPGSLPFVLSAAIVAGVAMISSFFPALRAALLSPMVAIRDEAGSSWQSARRGIGR